MKTLLLVLALLAAAQTTPMPPPGNPDHVTPAPDAFCRPSAANVDAGHACACHPTCMPGTDPEGLPDGTTHRVEDVATCRASCHPSHCKCASDCEP